MTNTTRDGRIFWWFLSELDIHNKLFWIDNIFALCCYLTESANNSLSLSCELGFLYLRFPLFSSLKKPFNILGDVSRTVLGEVMSTLGRLFSAFGCQCDAESAKLHLTVITFGWAHSGLWGSWPILSDKGKIKKKSYDIPVFLMWHIRQCFVFYSTVYIVPQVTDPDMRGNLLLIRPILNYFQRGQKKSRKKHTSSPDIFFSLYQM